MFEGMPTPLYAASPSRLLAYLECPRRYRFQYLDRPRPTSRPQRAHTSVGLATHNALRDWWDLPRGERTASGGAALLRKAWIETGFRDDDQSGRWRSRVGGEVRGLPRRRRPGRPSRAVSSAPSRCAPTAWCSTAASTASTSGRASTARSSSSSTTRPAGAPAPRRTRARRCRWPCMRPRPGRCSGAARCGSSSTTCPPARSPAHTHTVESLRRKLDEADSLSRDARAADASYRELGVESPSFPPLPSALCTWCDYRSACPEGQRMGPEKSSWAALEPGDERRTDGERYPEEELLEGTVRLGGRAGQPEGRGREDDLGGEPGGRVRRAG